MVGMPNPFPARKSSPFGLKEKKLQTTLSSRHHVRQRCVMDPSSGSVNDKHAARDHHQGPAQIDIELPPRHLFSTKQSALSPAKGVLHGSYYDKAELTGPLPATSERVVHNLRLSHAHEICHLDDQSGLTVNGGPIANVGTFLEDRKCSVF